MKTRTLSLLTLALLMGAASIAAAQPGAGRFAGRGFQDGSGPMDGWFCERLDLSEAQQSAIDGIRETSREAGLATRTQIVRLQNELEGLMLSDDPDAGDVEKLVRRIGELRTDQRVRRMQTRLEIRAQLTDEQRDELIALRGGRGRGFGGRGNGPGLRAPRGRGLGRGWF